MAEIARCEVILSDEQYDRFDGIQDVAHCIVDTIVAQENRTGFANPSRVRSLTAQLVPTLHHVSQAVVESVNSRDCPGGRPDTEARQMMGVEGGFSVSCASACMSALTKRCPLTRLSGYVDQELEGLSLQTKADLVAAQQAA